MGRDDVPAVTACRLAPLTWEFLAPGRYVASCPICGATGPERATPQEAMDAAKQVGLSHARPRPRRG